MRNYMKCAFVVVLMLALSSGALAREPQGAVSSIALAQSETEIQTALRRSLAELEERRKEVAALKEALGAKNEHVKALEAIIVEQAELIEQWKTAARERATANGLDQKIEQLYQKSIAAYAVELAAVRIDRDKQASQKKWWLAAGIIIGAVAGVFAAKD